MTPAAHHICEGEFCMTGTEIAALIGAGAFAMLVLVLAVPILRVRRTIDAATRAINDITDQTSPMLANVNTTVENVNRALGQVQTSLDGVNLQLEHVDAIVTNVQHMSANVANLVTVVTGAAASPVAKVAALGFGVRRAAAHRRHEAEEREVRRTLRDRRRTARRGQ
jgi:uncharacterized protein YoxC